MSMSMSENVDEEREQEQITLEEDGSGSGSVSNQDAPPRRGSSDSSRTTDHVRLWVLEISTSGLIDTPRPNTVRVTVRLQ